MQNSGLIRLAHSVFARPFCHQEAFASVVKGWQCPCVQRSVSTSATARDSSEAADSSDSASKSQQGASDVKDVAKVAHANELRQLRRKWKAQHAEKLAIKAKADAKKAANKAVMIEGHRRNVAAMKELRGQMHEEKRRLQFADMTQRQALAAQFRSATQQVYAQLKEQRREELLMQSKVWITPDTLDARIDEALENPIVLYETASDRQYSPSKDF